MTLGQKIVHYRVNAGMTQKRLAEVLGITPTRLNYWEKDKREPDVKMLNSLCDALKVDGDILLGRVQLDDRPVGSELALLQKYRSADPHIQRIVDVALEPFDARAEEPDDGNRPTLTVIEGGKGADDGDPFMMLDIYDQPSAAGLGNILDIPVAESQQYPREVVPRGTDYGIKISGHSMEPLIADGATAFVHETVRLEEGEIGIFIHNGEAFCKKLVRDAENRRVILHSVNPHYGDRVVDENLEQFKIVGRVLGSYPEYQAPPDEDAEWEDGEDG